MSSLPPHPDHPTANDLVRTRGYPTRPIAMRSLDHHTRRRFLRTCAATTGSLFAARPAFSITTTESPGKIQLVLNPYNGVDWAGWKRYRAQLHMHTLQSDGGHMLDEVVRCYQKAGYSILAITDHDLMAPNRARAATPTPYPLDPKPGNFPANTTWPWTDYGAQAPEHYHMLGIQANELTHRNHINSFFCATGFRPDDFDKSLDAAAWNDLELEAVRRDGGVAFLNHPGWERDWHRQPLDWYVDRFRKHPPETLLGLEVTNGSLETRPFDEGLWDQLLARFMPARPVWGFGTDDMHRLASARQAFSLFPAASLDAGEIRSAMASGRFLFCSSTNPIDYREESFTALDTFPEIHAIATDPAAGTITIDARDCDLIRWISAPASLDPTGDFRTDPAPFPTGTIVHEGPEIAYREIAGIRNYVRAELIRRDGQSTRHTYTSPFGFRHG